MMKKVSFILFLSIFSSTLCYSQLSSTKLTFNTKYVNAVDRWVVFPINEANSTYPYGFIYIDEQAGFTFHYQSTFKIINKKFVSQPKDSTEMYKVRLQPQTKPVAILNEKQTDALNLPDQPKWLRVYKKDKNKVGYLQRIGYHYNHAGASEKALEYLEKAYTIEPHYEGLEFELAFAYNATKQFKKAIHILDAAINNNSKNAYFYRELGFSYLNMDKVTKAEQVYQSGIKLSNSDEVKSEMAVNMAQVYYQKRNKALFNEWATITRKYATEGSQYLQYINYFEENWNE